MIGPQISGMGARTVVIIGPCRLSWGIVWNIIVDKLVRGSGVGRAEEGTGHRCLAIFIIGKSK